jgi:hypothetical protein
MTLKMINKNNFVMKLIIECCGKCERYEGRMMGPKGIILLLFSKDVIMWICSYSYQVGVGILGSLLLLFGLF